MVNVQGISPGRVLFVGLGISGMATALRLHGLGWDTVIVERAPARRTGGYFIATMGTGQAAAKRLGIFDDLPDRTPTADQVMYQVDRAGRRHRAAAIFDLPVDPKPMLMLRGDVENALFTALPADVEVRYSTVPTEITQDPDGVNVALRNTASGDTGMERFDLVIGADGLRSTVRKLVFGPDEQYLHRLGYMIAAFELTAPPGDLRIGDGAMQFEVDRTMIVYPFADHAPTALFTYRTDDVDAEFQEEPAQRLRAVYGPEPYGEILGQVLDEFAAADNFLFDSVEQPQLDSWHRGRVVLVGDSAWCPTLYSGMGSSTGLAGGELLGTVFEQHTNLEAALVDWESRMRHYTTEYQSIGRTGAKLFTPPGRFAVFARKLLMAARQTPLTAPVIGWAMRHAKALRIRNVDIAAAAGPSAVVG